MNNDKRPLIKVDLGWLEILAALGAMGIAGLLAWLVIGLNNREPGAYMVVGGFITLALILVGGGLVLGIMWFAYLMERGRERREQERWSNNARENLDIMQITARGQAIQNQMLLRQAQSLQRALPAPGDNLDVDALVFEDRVFAELEG